jgi:hypothetical protein
MTNSTTVYGQSNHAPLKHEILSNGQWVEVTDHIFRSWTGERRLNGSKYHGPIYNLGSDVVAIPFLDPNPTKI